MSPLMPQFVIFAKAKKKNTKLLLHNYRCQRQGLDARCNEFNSLWFQDFGSSFSFFN